MFVRKILLAFLALVSASFIGYTLIRVSEVNSLQEKVGFLTGHLGTLNSLEQELLSLSEDQISLPGYTEATLQSDLSELEVALQNGKIPNDQISRTEILCKDLRKLLASNIIQKDQVTAMLLLSKELQVETRKKNGRISVRLSEIWSVMNTLLIVACIMALLMTLGGWLMLKEIIIRKRIQKNLRVTNNELDQFISRVTHDIKNPLSSIISSTRLAEEENDPKKLKEHLDDISKKAWQLSVFVNDLLDVSKIKRETFEVHHIDVEPFVEEVLEGIGSLSPNGQDVDIRASYEGIDTILINRKLFSTILQNLVGNGVKYARKEEVMPFVKVHIHADPIRLRLRIEDNGKGIPENMKDKIFDIFTRADQETDGSGLGLHIVSEAVNRLKGSIKVESTQGKGSVFIVEIPL